MNEKLISLCEGAQSNVKLRIIERSLDAEAVERITQKQDHNFQWHDIDDSTAQKLASSDFVVKSWLARHEK